jgi:D-alanine-D-alanine ligase
MKIRVNGDWWKTMFDETYLLTDARSVCDDDITRREVDLICKLLPIRPDHEILDLCGGHGRHSLELSARGFTGCTLVDYSSCLIDRARGHAAALDYQMECVQSDARDTGLPSESFDHVLVMGNSLGYISKPAADLQILAEAKRVLRSGGWLLLDVTDGSAVRASFNPSAWHEIDTDIVVCRQREMKGNTLHAREIVLSKEKGLIRDRGYAIRLYTPETIQTILDQAGFHKTRVQTDFSPHQSNGDYGFMNCRMVALGQKS